jgi:hypothetical protein
VVFGWCSGQAYDFSGRYWARTSGPQLVDSEQRSGQFAPVRAIRVVEPKASMTTNRTERERTENVAIVAMRSFPVRVAKFSIAPGCPAREPCSFRIVPVGSYPRRPPAGGERTSNW